jgi:sporulation protein YlmC with PRC-barrel domain
MRKLASVMQITLFLVLTLLVAYPVAAQERRTQQHTEEQGEARGLGATGFMRGSEMMDTTVKDREGNDLGQIQDVVLDAQGRPVYGILAGPRNRYYPIPLQTLFQSVRDDHFVLNIDGDQIEHAPSFPRDEWPAQLTEAEWEQNIHSYYGDQAHTMPHGQQPSSGTPAPRGQ